MKRGEYNKAESYFKKAVEDQRWQLEHQEVDSSA
jgi:hypothetical protein